MYTSSRNLKHNSINQSFKQSSHRSTSSLENTKWETYFPPFQKLYYDFITSTPPKGHMSLSFNQSLSYHYLFCHPFILNDGECEWEMEKVTRQ
jgi:hypothetical protein